MTVHVHGDNAVYANNEWSTLKAVIVGRAEHSYFPSEPIDMVRATMPQQHWPQFTPLNPFPTEILKAAAKELDQLAILLKDRDIKVYRPDVIDWKEHKGYTGAMPRDGLLSVGNTLIEAPFAWACRRDETRISLGHVLNQLRANESNRIIAAPKQYDTQTIYQQFQSDEKSTLWAINNSRPAFDAADFVRFGNFILGQLSNVTNMKGIQYLRAAIPEGYYVELLEVDDPNAMHIDATILPLRQGLLIYNPQRTSEAAIRKHRALKDWEIHACPLPRVRNDDEPPLYMTSAWLMMNILSIDDCHAIVEESDTDFAEWIKSRGIEPIMCPFKNVHSIGGSFHCATVDILRV